MQTIFHTVRRHLLANKDLVLATIIDSSGSTPRKTGTHMLVGKEGLLEGTVGGGKVEGISIETAQNLLRSRESKEYHFVLNTREAANLGMICGGEVRIYFQFISCQDIYMLNLCEAAIALSDSNTDFWYLTDLSGKESPALYSTNKKIYGDWISNTDVLKNIPSMYKRIKTNGYDLFVEKFEHEGFAYLFGGGHVSQKVAWTLTFTGFRCVVLDDRPEFVDPSLFPAEVETILCDFNHISDYINITDKDYCCVLTRGHAYDLIVQAQLLATDAYYIGVIGSKSKTAAVYKRLREEFKIPEEVLARVHAPIGIDIKGDTPAEIAISIAAEMIDERAKRKQIR